MSEHPLILFLAVARTVIIESIHSSKGISHRPVVMNHVQIACVVGA